MRSKLKLIAAASSIVLLPAVAVAEQDKISTIDDLTTCTLIYSRTAELYQEQGQTQKSQEFKATTDAYGVVADAVAATAYGDELAPEYIDQRMMRILQALNEESERHEDGDLAVIAQWLEYCDSMGPRVQRVLDQLDY